MEEYLAFFRKEYNAEIERSESTWFNGSSYSPRYEYKIRFKIDKWSFQIKCDSYTRDFSEFTLVKWQIACTTTLKDNSLTFQVNRDSGFFAYFFLQTRYILKSSNTSLVQHERRSNRINIALLKLPYQVLKEIRSSNTVTSFSLETEFSDSNMSPEVIEKIIGLFIFLNSEIESFDKVSN